MQNTAWTSVEESDRAIKIETDKLEAVIPKNNPKHWMTGIEKGSFLDKATGFREIGDGLMVIDWLMEAGSDEDYSDQIIAPDGHGVGRYSWHENETEPERQFYTRMSHGSSHRKRMVEGPQLCHRMNLFSQRSSTAQILSRAQPHISTNTPPPVTKPDRAGHSGLYSPKASGSLC